MGGGTILEVWGATSKIKQKTAYRLLPGMKAKLIAASEWQSKGFVLNGII